MFPPLNFEDQKILEPPYVSELEKKKIFFL